MTDTKNQGDKTLHVSSKTLSLKRPVEQGTVRQSFSHGRSKSVVVETVKRRPAVGPGSGAKDERPAPQQAAAPVSAPKPAAPAPKPAAPAQGGRPQRSAPNTPRSGGMVLQTLSEQERDARMNALVDARRRDEEDRRRQAEEVARRAEREAAEAKEREAAEARKHEEEERRRQDEERKRRAEEEARRRLGEEAPRPASASAPAARGPAPRSDAPRSDRPRSDGPRPAGRFDGPRPSGPRSDGPRPGGYQRPGVGTTGGRPPSLNHMARPAAPVAPEPETAKPNVRTAPPVAARAAVMDDEEGARTIRRPGVAAKPAALPKTPKTAPGEEKRRGRLTLANATSGEDERTRSLASFRRRNQRLMGHRQVEQKEKIAREVTIPETITIQELANRMSERAVDVIKFLMKQGQMHKITDVIDADTAQIVAEELGHTVKRVAEADVEEGLFDTPDTDDNLSARPPVVTIMGHVDHGKTSLLDAIRKTNVVSGEAGGITQHIGAYQVTSPLGGKITFIDTPGHAAFTAMRARGAKVTDIVVLVVAADDGVMPQTIEAINHAQAAGVPLIVAINKVDKPDANPQRVRTELLQHSIVVESMGGETLEFEVSAKTGQGLETLLEGLQLQAEILELKANAERSAEGTVIEAKLDRGRGPVATVLVQRGTLHTGDIVVAGAEWGRVRALINDLGANVKEAGPSVPVEVLGFNGTPEAGDRVAVVESEARAREVTEYRTRQKRERQAARMGSAGRTLVDMMRDLKAGAGRKEFPLVVRADVQGSAEAIVGALEKVGNEEVAARIVQAGVGGISESDVTLAEASGAIILAFNVRAHKEAREAAERAGIEIRYYNIIYDLVDDVKAAMSGLLAPTLREERLGEAQVLEVFNVSKVGKIAGCRVLDGVVQRGAHVRLIRDNVVIHEGKLSQLKRFKDDAREVTSGQECGMSFENYQDMRVGDLIECYRVEEVKRTL
ncbi:translation initiation factor IF-2 [Microvirga lotononidis]|uniref:Translation initiation factor IF-2 n=1 Tax=Microvirga lotononidis TaxID=864069 RepID=I4YZ31_9HYPH|nr:translation initiation factor IF-2 [Microvirga lotononidis]EIM29223.1 translation initiation factor IF-2 [Microvirga lotononidis]WQO29058.1 translation initiation factor IF-2 [Microvirga lotononidis]